jgi:hypothetical protein
MSKLMLSILNGVAEF